MKNRLTLMGFLRAAPVSSGSPDAEVYTLCVRSQIPVNAPQIGCGDVGACDSANDMAFGRSVHDRQNHPIALHEQLQRTIEIFA